VSTQLQIKTQYGSCS